MDERTKLTLNESIDSGSFWSKRTFLEKVFLALLVVVIAVGIILAISFASYTKEHCHECEKVCETSECVKSAAYLISSMDTSVDPCEDFFSFACGGYMNNTFLLGNRVGRFTKLSVNIMLRMKELLGEPMIDSDPEHWKKTKIFYGDCMDLVSRQKLTGTPLKHDLEALGKWPLISSDWTGDAFKWPDTLKLMFDKGFNKDILLKIDVDLDLKNSSNTLLLIDQPVLTMPRILYLLDAPYDYAVREYENFILKCAYTLGEKIDIVKTLEEIKDAVNLEIRLAKASIPPGKRKNLGELYDHNIITLNELQDRYKKIPWKQLLDNFLPESVNVTGDEKIWIPVHAVIEEVEKIVSDNSLEGKRQLANYMMYRAVLMGAHDLSHVYVQSLHDFHNALTGTPYSYPSPWQDCVDITGFYFYYSISSVYTKKYFQKSSKENVKAMEANIKQVLKDQISDAPWIDDITQDGALLKAERMRAIIGYPEDILNDTILNSFYTELDFSGNHYENVRGAYRFFATRTMEGLHKKYNKNRWDATGNLLMANAFYSPIKNSITIPVGVLQEETYNGEKPNYLNYGSLGMLIGHELTHGFDMTGSQFDEKGDWKVWWTNESNAEFEDRSRCFVDQYDSYMVPGTNKTVNGTLTLDENMADTGGLQAAYKAYQRWIKKNGKEKQLPGLAYKPNQLFWLSFASVWCSKETPAHLLYAIMFQEHAPPKYRTKGALSNLKEFSEDFNCKKGSAMNPENKCLMWA